jgi:TRAP-type C4-dicarboxylate transport system substrate-binding protein
MGILGAFEGTDGDHLMFKQCLALVVALGAGAAIAQTKWDLPSAYPASNFHTENLQQFAADVDKASSYKKAQAAAAAKTPAKP